MPLTLSRYRIYAGRKRVGVVTETLDGVQIETSDLILRVELEQLLANPTAERTGGTFGNILPIDDQVAALTDEIWSQYSTTKEALVVVSTGRV